MKKISLIAGMLLITATASAQFANSNSNVSSTIVDTDNYNRITLSYNPQTLTYDYKGADDLTLNGFSLGYTAGISLSKKYPMFIEVGARLNYSFKTQDIFEDMDFDDEEEEAMDELFNSHSYTTSYMNLAIPVNFAYKFKIGKNVAITPYLGLVLKANILAMTSYNLELSEVGKDLVEDEDDYDMENINYFSKKDVGEDNTWNRVQIGWNIGAGIDYKKFYLGFSYGTDFMEISKKTNTSNYAITLGVNF